jgi:DNA ligase-1
VKKYDGLRGYWDGQRLLSRGGEALKPPAWFTEGWPLMPMDGERWAGRARFEEATSTVRQQVPNDAAWRRIRSMVFDLPDHPGGFDERLKAYQILLREPNRPWLWRCHKKRSTTVRSCVSGCSRWCVPAAKA